MSKTKLGITLFVLLSSIAGLFLGMLLSRFLIPKGVGLAGGAMVLGYGVVGFVISLIAALMLHRFFTSSQLKTFTLLFGIFNLAMIGWVVLKMNEKNPESQSLDTPNKVNTEPTNSPNSPPAATLKEDTKATSGNTLSIGIGMAKPHFETSQTLLLYSQKNENQLPADFQITDSVTFKNYEVATAPSWFLPEHLKLDYQILYLIVKSQKEQFLEVVVNRETGQTAWVKKESVDLKDWPAFLTGVFSVEAKNYANNPVRIKPATHEAPLKEANANDTFHAIEAKGDWLKVEVMDDDYNKKGEGWIRWRDGKELLVLYSLLS